MAPSPTVDIIIPTLKRPGNVLVVTDDIRRYTPRRSYRITFVTDEDDAKTNEVIQTLVAGLDVNRIVRSGTFPKKINTAVAVTEGDWVLCCGDDVKFKPGWYEATVEATKLDKAVIGTNDKTPRTRNRDHATAQLVRRDYIEHPGAAWREPGHVFHEGYHHQYADNELCNLAWKRGEWHFADDIVIEHPHPVWGTREWDEVYRLGQSNGLRDKRLFRQRHRLWAKSLTQR